MTPASRSHGLVERTVRGIDHMLAEQLRGGRLPYLLSSRPVIVFGILLFFYLFAGLATLFGHPGAVSTNTQLIFGNYTDVTSSAGAGIAAGASLTLLKYQHRNHRAAQAALDATEEAHAPAQETHRLIHSLHYTPARGPVRPNNTPTDTIVTNL